MFSLAPAASPRQRVAAVALLAHLVLAHGLIGLLWWQLTPTPSSGPHADATQRATALVHVTLLRLHDQTPLSSTATVSPRSTITHTPTHTPPRPAATAVAEAALRTPDSPVDTPSPTGDLLLAAASNAASTESAPPAPATLQQARPHHDKCPPAPYPALLRERGIEGVVRVQVRVDPEGRAAEARVVGGSGWRLFDEAAVQRALACHFLPARRGNVAVEDWVDFSVRFALLG